MFFMFFFIFRITTNCFDVYAYTFDICAPIKFTYLLTVLARVYKAQRIGITYLPGRLGLKGSVVRPPPGRKRKRFYCFLRVRERLLLPISVDTFSLNREYGTR